MASVGGHGEKDRALQPPLVKVVGVTGSPSVCVSFYFFIEFFSPRVLHGGIKEALGGSIDNNDDMSILKLTDEKPLDVGRNFLSCCHCEVVHWNVGLLMLQCESRQRGGLNLSTVWSTVGHSGPHGVRFGGTARARWH